MRRPIRPPPDRPPSPGTTLPQPATPPSSSSPPAKTERPTIHFLSALRLILTALVIFHHTAIPYGGLGVFEHKSPVFPDRSIDPLLATFNVLDQSFFVAMFFWLAGYLSHRELQRRRDETAQKGGERRGLALDDATTAKFVWHRITRLVVPALFYTAVLKPLEKVVVFLGRGAMTTSVDGSSVNALIGVFRDCWSDTRGIRGPVWFSVLLAIFDVSTALLSASPLAQLKLCLFDTTSRETIKRLIDAAVPLVIFTSVQIRSAWPVGRAFRPLNLQLAFLPQYIFAYCVGHLSAGLGDMYVFAVWNKWPGRSVQMLIHAIMLQLLTLGLIVLVVFRSAAVGQARGQDSMARAMDLTARGTRLPAFLYAVWNESGFMFIGPSLLAACEERLNFPLTVSLWWRRPADRRVSVARYAYATFMVHVPVSLALEIWIDNLLLGSGWLRCVDSTWLWKTFGPSIMTTAVGSLNVAASFTTAMLLVEWIPGLGRWI